MRKIIFITILLFCFTFSLWADSFYDLSVKYPISMLGKGKITSYGETEYLRLDASNLSSQGLQTNSSNSTSGWKKAGIYGAEFVAGLIGSLPPFVYAVLYIYATTPDLFNIGEVFIATGDALFVGPITWATGKAFKQEGSLKNAMIGAGIGGFLGSLLWCYDPYNLLGLGLFFAPLGAVIGNNL